MSASIERLLALASSEGLAFDCYDFSGAKVRWFESAMPQTIREAGQSDDRLRHFLTDHTPHNRADEGFIDDSVKVAVSFAKV